jgi:hypothetical protein
MVADVTFSRSAQIAARSHLRHVAGERDIGRRLCAVAHRMLGRPYAADALVGGPNQPEELVIDLRRFDCVTFVESALALARSRTPAGFRRELIRLRYRDGRVAWRSRLHYFSDWLRANHRRGAVRIRTRGNGARSLETCLGTLAGLPARSARFWVVPKANLPRALARIDEGAVVAFASLRGRLDFFHVGLVFGSPAGRLSDLTLVHASRSGGGVVAVPFVDFLRGNRMRGVAFATPLGAHA